MNPFIDGQCCRFNNRLEVWWTGLPWSVAQTTPSGTDVPFPVTVNEAGTTTADAREGDGSINSNVVRFRYCRDISLLLEEKQGPCLT